MIESHLPAKRLWGPLPYTIVVVMLIALGIIIYAGGQRMMIVAEELAQEDAEAMYWWYLNQREQLNRQVMALANQASDSQDFEALAAAVGLAEPSGYLAWLGPDKTVKAVLNAEALRGDPANTKMFAFVPAIGQPASDLWQDDRPYFISMAAVSEEQGGGVIMMQVPVDSHMMDQLASLTGRDVMLYSFEDQQAQLSSNERLISDPPQFDPTWMKEVATGQVPDSVRTRNQQGSQIVGLTAFPDFAGVSYSGYIALVEPTQTLTQRIPWFSNILLILVALAVLAIAGFILQSQIQTYLGQFRARQPQQRGAFKWRMVGLTLLLVLPSILIAWVAMARLSTVSKVLDLRTAQIAKDILIEAFENLTDQVSHFVDTSTMVQASDTTTMLEKIRLANSFDFVVSDSETALIPSDNEVLSPEMVSQLKTLEAGQLDLLTFDHAVLLVGTQTSPDGTVVSGGYRLDRRLDKIADEGPADVSLFDGTTPLISSLNDRELATISFDPRLEEQLKQDGQVSYTQKVHWHDSKLTLQALTIGDLDQLRLLISQPSITWLNAISAYQFFGFGVIAAALVIIVILLVSMLNLDRPVMMRKLYTGYLFILPALIWLVWWRMGPTFFMGFLSFHKWSVLTPAKPYVGLHHYNLIAQDEKFWNAMGNTLVYITQIPLGMAIALALAMALNQQIRGIRVLRTIYYMPAVTSIVVVSLMWKLLYNKDLGVFNYLLDFIGLGPYGWLQSPNMAMPSIMAMAVWLGLGARMLLFLAGLQSIPNELYEAANVDGAGGWHKFWHITLPLLAPTTFFVLVTSVIQSFQVFGPIYVLTDGGPAGATDVAVYRIYFEAWQNLRFGYASAETVILFACLFVVTALQFRYFGRRVSYG